MIGNGHAGFHFLQELHRLDASWKITVFEQEDGTPYDRLGLSGALAGTVRPAELSLSPAGWYASAGIELLGRTRVDRLDAADRRLVDQHGREHRFDACLLATGSEPLRPSIPGVLLDGVYTFRTLEDATALAARVRPGVRAVVVGAGLLGVEVACALRLRGVPVTALHLADRVMERQLDAQAAAVLRSEIERLDVEVRLGTTAAAVLGGRRAEGVVLDTGETLPAELVVICTGVRPSVALAAGAGLRTGRGVMVDDHLATSAPDVYAIGECTEHRGRTFGLVDAAHEQARVLARRLAGDREAALAHGPEVAMLKVSGLRALAAGCAGGTGDRAETIRDDAQGVYKKLLFRGDVLAGAILVGDLRQQARVVAALRARQPVADSRALLGLGPLAPAADLPDDALVCGCRRVAKAAVLAALSAGCRTRDCVAERTGATRSCGGCADAIEELIESVPVPA